MDDLRKHELQVMLREEVVSIILIILIFSDSLSQF
jgi:hypothetical protein